MHYVDAALQLRLCACSCVWSRALIKTHQSHGGDAVATVLVPTSRAPARRALIPPLVRAPRRAQCRLAQRLRRLRVPACGRAGAPESASRARRAVNAMESASSSSIKSATRRGLPRASTRRKWKPAGHGWPVGRDHPLWSIHLRQPQCHRQLLLFRQLQGQDPPWVGRHASRQHRACRTPSAQRSVPPFSRRDNTSRSRRC
jgi:hypothetical protein